MAEPVARSIAAFLALVLACGVLIAATAALTRERIEENRARRFLETLGEVAGSMEAAAEVVWVGDVGVFCGEGFAIGAEPRPREASLARTRSLPQRDQVLLRGAAPGYGGDIHWLAAADVAREAPLLERARITAHQETPGIADFLDHPGRGWLAALQGKPADQLVRIDAVSGATITSRALTRSLADALSRPRLGQAECPE